MKTWRSANSVRGVAARASHAVRIWRPLCCACYDSITARHRGLPRDKHERRLLLRLSCMKEATAATAKTLRGAHKRCAQHNAAVALSRRTTGAGCAACMPRRACRRRRTRQHNAAFWHAWHRRISRAYISRWRSIGRCCRHIIACWHHIVSSAACLQLAEEHRDDKRRCARSWRISDGEQRLRGIRCALHRITRSSVKALWRVSTAHLAVRIAAAGIIETRGMRIAYRHERCFLCWLPTALTPRRVSICALLATWRAARAHDAAFSVSCFRALPYQLFNHGASSSAPRGKQKKTITCACSSRITSFARRCRLAAAGISQRRAGKCTSYAHGAHQCARNACARFIEHQIMVCDGIVAIRHNGALS